MGRAPCCEKVGLKKGRWTAEEDKILTDYIQENGEGSWRSLPKNAGVYLHIHNSMYTHMLKAYTHTSHGVIYVMIFMLCLCSLVTSLKLFSI